MSSASSISSVRIEIHDKSVQQIIPEETVVEQIASGFGFTEGPVWCGDYLLFSDIPQNRIVRWRQLTEGPEVPSRQQTAARKIDEGLEVTPTEEHPTEGNQENVGKVGLTV